MIDFPINEILPALGEFNITLTEKQIESLNKYANLLIEWNEKMNLTAITEPSEVVWKHFYDCILLFKDVDIKKGARVIDVGTGAGFPGMVLKIVREDINLTLLDGLNKRLVFLSQVLEELNLSASVVHLRAEEGAKKAEYREQYDYAVARAVANMNVLSEYCMPYVKVGGFFAALKGPAGREEAENAKKALSILGGGKTTVFAEGHQNIGERTIVVTQKVSPTPPKYPRISAKISKQPL